jgi:glycyl-tRNA synthetase beta chain
MQDHQKFFPVVDNDGNLMARFITVANIASTDIRQVRAGNERVIRPRLEDASFFWSQDLKQTLDSRVAALDKVTYQNKLGSLGDKQQRITAIAAQIAATIGADIEQVKRAARLCKCDLLTRMVYEFPKLQGTMGRYYALNDGEDKAVADALAEQYQPRFAGDVLPATPAGKAIALADRLDTLAGIFAIGQSPTGDKDPFGLRRAALGVLRILIECRIEIDLTALIETAISGLPADVSKNIPDDLKETLYNFMMERLRTWYLDAGHDVETFEAVLSRRPASPLDFDQRINAVRAFAALPEAESLSAANKRISNILRKAENDPGTNYRAELFLEDAEKHLAQAVQTLGEKVTPLYRQREYTAALAELAALREPVDRFFDDVMVMADDPQIRDNRLALLNALSSLFLDVADISRLQNQPYPDA